MEVICLNSSFANNMLYLRKERGIRQKQAADELGISQSLLSHYEKGIRECGLDFVVKAADYYSVTCDYLLGRTAQRTAQSSAQPENTDVKSKKSASDNANRQVIVNTIDFFYSILSQIRDRDITRFTSEIIMTELYEVFRMLYPVNPQNDEHFFILSGSGHESYVSSHSEYKKAKLSEAVEKLSKSRQTDRKPLLSYEIIMSNYSDTAPSVLDLIHAVEKSVKK